MTCICLRVVLEKDIEGQNGTVRPGFDSSSDFPFSLGKKIIFFLNFLLLLSRHPSLSLRGAYEANCGGFFQKSVFLLKFNKSKIRTCLSFFLRGTEPSDESCYSVQ